MSRIIIFLSVLMGVLGSFVYTVPQDVWQQTHYVWDFAMISSVDKGLNKNPKQYFLAEHTFDASAYQNIQAGDVVWLKCRLIPQFCEEILPTLSKPIVLMIADGDATFPSDCGVNVEPLLNHKRISHD